MARLWDWYRERRWWTKTLIAAPLVLIAIVGLYLVARALQYRSAALASAAEFAPEEAQVVVRSTDGARHWARLQSTEFWKILRTKMLKDAAVRRELNAALKEAGAPTLDDLEDRRWIERSGMSESRLVRLAGNDLMAAVRLGDVPAQTRFCVATRLGYWEYALLPFAPLVRKQVEIEGHRCYRFGRLTVAAVGAIAVASDDPRLLVSALKRRGRAGPARKPVEATVAFERSALLADARRRINAFPAGGLCLFVDGQSLQRAHVTVDVDGADLIVDARLEGMTTPGGDAPADAARYVPQSGAGAVLLNVGGDRLCDWIRGVSEAPPRDEVERIGQQMAREMMSILSQGQFQQRVPARVRGPISLVLGTSVGLEQRTFGSCAMVLRTDDPASAEQGLRETIQDLTKGAKERITIRTQMVQGQTVWALDFGADPFKYTDYLRPCWLVYRDALVLANNLDFLMSVVTAAATEQNAMLNEAFYRAAESRLEKLGLARVLKDGTVANGFVYGPAMREGIEGFWPIVANKLTDSDAARQKLRAELETDWRQTGRNPSGADFVQEFNSVLQERIGQMERSLRARARALDYVRWGAFEVVAEEGGLRLRAAVELK